MTARKIESVPDSPTVARATGDVAAAPVRRAGRHAPALVRFAAIFLALLAIDLTMKAVAFGSLAAQPVSIERDQSGALLPIPHHAPLVLVPRVLAMTLTLNEGALFGLGQGRRWLFVAFSAVALVVIGWVFVRTHARAVVAHVALAAVLAGALGNLYDRLRFGAVRDMLWLFPGVELPFGWRWPDGSAGLYPWIFNVADACLMMGLGVLLVVLHRHDRKSSS